MIVVYFKSLFVPRIKMTKIYAVPMINYTQKIKKSSIDFSVCVLVHSWIVHILYFSKIDFKNLCVQHKAKRELWRVEYLCETHIS